MLVIAAGPAKADVTWSPKTFTLTETWDNYLTDPLVSGSDSANLTIDRNENGTIETSRDLNEDGDITDLEPRTVGEGE